MEDINTASFATLPTITMGDTLPARLALVATTCCVCAKDLADATSVEMGIGPTCRKRYAKLDKEAAESAPPTNWDLVADALGDFAAVDRNDTGRIALFEMAMAQIEIARTGAAHTLANMITHYIAATQARRDSIGGLIIALDRMGRPNLANALRKQQFPIRIEAIDGGTLHVFSPFSDAFRTSMWRTGAGRWNRDLKCYVVAGSRGVDLHGALVLAYRGMRAIGPKGEFAL